MPLMSPQTLKPKASPGVEVRDAGVQGRDEASGVGAEARQPAPGQRGGIVVPVSMGRRFPCVDRHADR